MIAMMEENFVDLSKISVIIPYSDLEKILTLARDVEVMKAQYLRMQEQYSAIYGMFSEVLQIVRETREFVKDT